MGVDAITISAASIIVSVVALVVSFYATRINLNDNKFDSALRMFELSDKIYSRYIASEADDRFAVGQVMSCIELESGIMNKGIISGDIADLFKDSLANRIEYAIADFRLSKYISGCFNSVDSSHPNVFSEIRRFIETNVHLFNDANLALKMFSGQRRD
jgi:hypothetical protein